MAGTTKDGGSGIHQGGTAHFVVDPDHLLKLRNDIRAIEEELQHFLQDSGWRLTMKPPGADPVSFDTATMFTNNGERAVAAAWAFHQQLAGFRKSLDASAKKYRLADDDSAASFEGGQA